MRVRERILAKFWRASRAEFNSRARSLYGIGAVYDHEQVWQPCAVDPYYSALFHPTTAVPSSYVGFVTICTEHQV